MSALTIERLKELLKYDHKSGIFTWRQRRGGAATAGSMAGAVSGGRIQIRIDGFFYKAHRLAWLYVHGKWPNDEIDHKDGDVANNRIANLREATPAQNRQNMRKAQSNNKVNLLGVSLAGDQRRIKKWQAQISAGRRYYHLGYFITPEEAHRAYIKAKRRIHPFGTL
jgi:hypothetical protein